MRYKQLMHLLLLVPLVVSSTPSGFESVEASSTLAGGFEASRMLDWDESTAWCEGAATDGVGEKIVLVLPPDIDTKGLIIRSGNFTSAALFIASGAPKTLEVAVKNADVVVRKQSLTLDRHKGAQSFALDAHGGTSLELVVLAVHPGDKINNRGGDTCITDLYLSSSAPAPEPVSSAPMPPVVGQHVKVIEGLEDISDDKLAARVSPELFRLSRAARDATTFRRECVGGSSTAFTPIVPSDPDMAPMLFDAFAFNTATFFRRETIVLTAQREPGDPTAWAASATAPRLLLDEGETKVCYVYDAKGRLQGAVEAHSNGVSHGIVHLRGAQDLIQAVDRWRANTADADVPSWTQTTFALSAKKAKKHRGRRR